MQVLYSFVKLITKFMSSSIVFGFQIEKIVLFLLEKQGLPGYPILESSTMLLHNSQMDQVYLNCKKHIEQLDKNF